MARRLLLATVVLMAGCASGGETRSKVGEDVGVKPRTLTMITPDLEFADDPGLPVFIREVERRSGGRLRIEPKGIPYAQVHRLAGMVKSGQYDLGWSPIRDLAVDSPGLAAVISPMVIDSYELEAELLASGLFGHVLPEIRRLGLEGLALLPGFLTYPWSTIGPLRTPLDWERVTGIVLADSPAIKKRAFRAMGVRSIRRADVGAGIGEEVLRGRATLFEYGVPTLSFIPLGHLGVHVTLNAPIGARMLAIYANPAHLARLWAKEREWLEQAARAAERSSLRKPADDLRQLARECRVQGVRAVVARPEDVDALRERALRVYRTGGAPEFLQVLDLVEGVRRRLAPPEPLEIPAQCRGPVPAAVPPVRVSSERRALDGVYRYQVTAQGYREDGVDPLVAREAAGTLTVTLAAGRGTFRKRERTSTTGADDPVPVEYRVAGDRVTFVSPHIGYSTARFKRLPDGSLRFSDLARVNHWFRQDLEQVWRRVR